MSCAGCGLSTDTDHDGVPDQLNALIEQKARQLLAEQKVKEAADAEAAKRAEAEATAAAERERERARFDQSLEWASSQLERDKVALAENAATKRPRVASVLRMFGAAIMVALGLGVAAMGCEGCIDQSISGRLFCDRACPGCRPPGRVFSSHDSISNSTSWVQLCHNDAVDIDQVGHFASSWPQYSLSMWWGYPVYVLIFWLGGAVALPFLAGRSARHGLDTERVRLIQNIERNEELLREHGRAGGSRPYR